MATDDLAPGLLLAAPRLHDPNFEKTVVLLGRSGEEGALGWVINGRELMPVQELFATSGLVPAGVVVPTGGAFALGARVGGPVSPAAGWLLYRRGAEPVAGELEVGPEIGVTGELSVFNDLLAGSGPRDFRLVLGCAGWAPGQLEHEIGAGAWLPASVDSALLFDMPLDEIWDEAYRRSVGAEPAAFTGERGRA
jgi:putative transcriptional regulator